MKTNRILSFFLLCAGALMIASCSNENITGNSVEENNKEAKGIVFTSIGDNVTRDTPNTRTSISHIIGNGATAYWSTGDKIWVKATDGNFKQSAAGVLNANKTRGDFSLSTGTYVNQCDVHYTGLNSSNGNSVTIASTQNQTTPNDFSHAGESGDCGSAKATGDGTNFTFKLNHKAAYLCFLPQSPSSTFANCTLTKVEVISDNAIAGDYDFTTGSLGTTPTANGSNTITLNTTNFPLTNTSASAETNASYMVIAPGTHKLVIKYWIHSNVDNIDGTVTKVIDSRSYSAGNIYDVSSNLDTRVYHEKYYMWDAAVGEDYWKGFESSMPLVLGGHDENYPKTNADSRWYRETSFPSVAEQSAKDCPNINEITWYINDGDIHWDSSELFYQLGHFYKGGAWILKKDNIAGYSSTIASDGIDYRTYTTPCTINKTPIAGTPNSADITKYFFKLALGHYYLGTLWHLVGIIGQDVGLRTSSLCPDPQQRSYILQINSGSARVDIGDYCDNGVPIWKAE